MTATIEDIKADVEKLKADRVNFTNFANEARQKISALGDQLAAIKQTGATQADIDTIHASLVEIDTSLVNAMNPPVNTAPPANTGDGSTGGSGEPAGEAEPQP